MTTNYNRSSYPKVYITSNALTRLKLYYKHCTTGEISGLGSVYADNGNMVVDDVVLLDQVSTPGDTELNQDALGRWLTELIRARKDPSLYRLWWHKHPIEGWSSIDEHNIDIELANGAWELSIVQTPTRLLGRLDLYEPFRITMDELTIIELRTADIELEENIKEEIKAKVKRPVYQGMATQFGQQSYIGPGGAVMYPGQRSGTGFDSTDPDEEAELKKNSFRNRANVHTASAGNSGAGYSGGLVDPREQAAFFEALADEDWEWHFHWEELYQIIP